MIPWRILYQITKADFLERSRRYSFLITLGLTIYFVYLYLPPLDSGYLTFGLGHYRGIYNSAWVGSIVAIMSSVLLSLPGFYLVKNAIRRDRETGVGQIIAATPNSKWLYVLGKAISNFVFLGVMVFDVTIAAIGMQLIRGESMQIDLLAFIVPLLLITLPVMALIGAMAVVFETVSWLRGGFGNVLFFFLWISTLTISVAGSAFGGFMEPVCDPYGVTVITSGMMRSAHEYYPDYHQGFSIGFTEVDEPVRTFVWEGVAWKTKMVLWRLSWFIVALGLASLASVLFKRFDPSRESLSLRKPIQKSVSKMEPAQVQPDKSAPVVLTRMTGVETNCVRAWVKTVLAEFVLMLKGLPWWWYLAALAMILVSLFSPTKIARQNILPIVWIWPLMIWSAMGSREVRNHTNQIVFSAPSPLSRQLSALWVAGVLVSLVASSGVSARLLVEGQWFALVALLVGAAFIPALALALGVWSGGRKLFEVVFILLWYFGPMNHAPFLDFMGSVSELPALRTSFIYLVVTLALLVLAWVGRKRQIVM